MATAENNPNRPWTNAYATGVPEHIEFEKTCIPDYLERAVCQHADRVALIFQGFRLTYRQLDDMVNRLAAGLIDLGVSRGDRVAILLPNMIPCVVSYYAILKIGAIAVMNNPLYTDRELKYQLNDSGAGVLITLDLLADRMTALRSETGIREIIYTSIGDYLPFPKNIFFRLFAKKKNLTATVKTTDRVYRWKNVLTRFHPEPVSVSIHENDIAMCQYTGGTTGTPKGVMLTHRNLCRQLQQIKAWFPHFQEGAALRMLSALPFFHIFGITAGMNFSIFMGWSNILVPRPQPGPLLENIRKFRPSFAPLVPTMYIGMLNHPDIHKSDLKCLQGCFSGSAPLPVEVIKAFEKKTDAIIVEGFGMSETSPITHINPFDRKKRKPGSVGLPLPDTHCRIVSLKDRKTEVPSGEKGELLIKGPQVMKGYWQRPAETAAVLEDEWLHTGDIAVMDKEGYFYIVDRIKDMIISGGFNVYPRDIDEVLYENPKIKEACSIGIPHATRGEAVKSFVVLKENHQATQSELIAFCKKRLAAYKLPVTIEFRKALPKSGVGKILRKNLEAEERQKKNTGTSSQQNT